MFCTKTHSRKMFVQGIRYYCNVLYKDPLADLGKSKNVAFIQSKPGNQRSKNQTINQTNQKGTGKLEIV